MSFLHRFQITWSSRTIGEEDHARERESKETTMEPAKDQLEVDLKVYPESRATVDLQARILTLGLQILGVRTLAEISVEAVLTKRLRILQ
jgi:hypothetical protein